ncbi:uncharacterized protein CANTADRAFT_27505 [Suhomyces tanzawaensis NRRL Y-17324]|uniref:Uncharacterized protein n=1 Tax=Suhomyces tanzawaensis NRRL Y-17324 TaxID=984487 RepID=A0A1E4SCN6_9ASCO|nr:uncharacterized protein CANTADRAFT_27505 [Suhomyces tanzawaensis NRRL Y-17324]ODV77152.1 hypothetical protein CANTADRAFT_27505 [Suhomyces tanzawaensis NRRL Y-17324]
MTLTKYQRGDQIEGWNDCPPMVMSRTSSSSSVLKSKSRRAANPVAAASSRSSSGLLPSELSPTPTIATAIPTATSPATPTSLSSDHSPEVVAALIHSVLQKPSKLPERELAHYEQKLGAHIKSLSLQHLDFIHSVTTRLLAVIDSGESREDIKKEVLDYMILHDGVSLWCSPLKKIVTGVV